MVHKKYANAALIFSQTRVKVSHNQGPNNAQDINVINVAGKKTMGLIA